MPDYYAILGVKETAKPEAIRAAYRRLAKKYHPDLHPGNAEFQQKFISGTEAYGILSDAGARARYDAERQPKPAESFDTGQRANLYRENPYKDVRFVYHNDRKPDAPDWQKLVLTIVTSPLTYCGIAFLLMLLGLKELAGSFHALPH